MFLYSITIGLYLLHNKLMNQEKDSKKIERKAKSLLLDKDIPPSKMEIVRSLMNNKDILARSGIVL